MARSAARTRRLGARGVVFFVVLSDLFSSSFHCKHCAYIPLSPVRRCGKTFSPYALEQTGSRPGCQSCVAQSCGSEAKIACPPTHHPTASLRVRKWSLSHFPVISWIFQNPTNLWISESSGTISRGDVPLMIRKFMWSLDFGDGLRPSFPHPPADYCRSRPQGGNSCRPLGCQAARSSLGSNRFSRAAQCDCCGDASQKMSSVWRPSRAPNRFQARAFLKSFRRRKGVGAWQRSCTNVRE